MKRESAGKAREKNGRAGRRRRVVRRIVGSVKPRRGQIGARHVEAVLELARNGHSGSSLTLPGGVEVRKERDLLVFRANEKWRVGAAGSTAREFEYNIDLFLGTQEVRIPEL